MCSFDDVLTPQDLQMFACQIASGMVRFVVFIIFDVSRHSNLFLSSVNKLCLILTFNALRGRNGNEKRKNSTMVSVYESTVLMD